MWYCSNWGWNFDLMIIFGNPDLLPEAEPFIFGQAKPGRCCSEEEENEWSPKVAAWEFQGWQNSKIFSPKFALPSNKVNYFYSLWLPWKVTRCIRWCYFYRVSQKLSSVAWVGTCQNFLEFFGHPVKWMVRKVVKLLLNGSEVYIQEVGFKKWISRVLTTSPETQLWSWKDYN